MATSSGNGGSGREGSAKSAVADQISQSVQSTSNILHLMLQSSPSHIPTNEASEEPPIQDLYDKKYRNDPGEAASSNFGIG
ncbi:hypothetical protein OROMI_016007 [Orobanche minor]